MQLAAGKAEAISLEGGIRNVELDVVKTFIGDENRKGGYR
jgi:hypothetical protein